MNATQTPRLGQIKRETGIAGQVSYSVTVEYAGEEPSRVTFVGNVIDGPVVMVLPTAGGRQVQTFVSEPSRFGSFGPEWVRRFFTDEEV